MSPELTNDQRRAVAFYLLERKKDENKNKLKRGAVKEASENFNCRRKTVIRIWNQYHASVEQNPNVDNKKKGNCGRKHIDRSDALEAKTHGILFLYC